MNINHFFTNLEQNNFISKIKPEISGANSPIKRPFEFFLNDEFQHHPAKKSEANRQKIAITHGKDEINESKSRISKEERAEGKQEVTSQEVTRKSKDKNHEVEKNEQGKDKKAHQNLLREINVLLEKFSTKMKLDDEGQKLLKQLKSLLESLVISNENGAWGSKNETSFFLNQFLKDFTAFLQENLKANPSSQAHLTETNAFLKQKLNAFKDKLVSFNVSLEKNSLNDLKELWEDFKSFENKKETTKSIQTPTAVNQTETNAYHFAKNSLQQGNLKNSLEKNKTFSVKKSRKSSFAPDSPQITVSPTNSKAVVSGAQSGLSQTQAVKFKSFFHHSMSSNALENGSSFYFKSENAYGDFKTFHHKANLGQKLDFSLLQNQLIKTIKNGLVQNQNVMTVKLKPQLLGEIKIIMKKQSDFMSLKFIVDNNHVKEVMESKMAELKQDLAKENIDVLSLDVDVHEKKYSQEGDFARWLSPEEGEEKIFLKEATKENEDDLVDVVDLRERSLLNLKA